MINKFINWFNSKWGWFFTNGMKQAVQEKDSTQEDMQTVAEALKHAKEYKLETEVVTWALKFMKADPKLTVGEAITLGYFEWVK